MTEDKEAELKALEKNLIEDQRLVDMTKDQLLSELKSAWEREKILRDGLARCANKTDEFGFVVTKDVVIAREALAKAEQVK